LIAEMDPGYTHSIDLLLGELDDDEYALQLSLSVVFIHTIVLPLISTRSRLGSGLAELEQELGLNDDVGGSGEYPMSVLQSATAGGASADTHSSFGGTSPPRSSGAFPGFLSSSSPSPSSSSSLSFGRRDDGGNVGERGELAIVQQYKQKFNIDAIQAQDAADNTVKAVFIVKFDVNEGSGCGHYSP
jgi:hypothetical protein